MSIRLRFEMAGVLTAITTCLLAGDLSADDGLAPGRPFLGQASGVATSFPAPNEIIVEAAGVATHLGAFTREEHLILGARIPSPARSGGTSCRPAARPSSFRPLSRRRCSEPASQPRRFTCRGDNRAARGVGVAREAVP